MFGRVAVDAYLEIDRPADAIHQLLAKDPLEACGPKACLMGRRCSKILLREFIF
jgi:hypothetical protein